MKHLRYGLAFGAAFALAGVPQIADACTEGQISHCTLPDGCEGILTCTAGGWWDECLPKTCDDGNPLTYGDYVCHSACAGTPVPFNIAVFDSLTKIQKHQPITSSRSGASLTAARNEFEAFQLAIQPPAGFFPVTVSASALTGPAGFRVLPQVYREEFISSRTPEVRLGMLPHPPHSSTTGVSLPSGL